MIKFPLTTINNSCSNFNLCISYKCIFYILRVVRSNHSSFSRPISLKLKLAMTCVLVRSSKWAKLIATAPFHYCFDHFHKARLIFFICFFLICPQQNTEKLSRGIVRSMWFRGAWGKNDPMGIYDVRISACVWRHNYEAQAVLRFHCMFSCTASAMGRVYLKNMKFLKILFFD